MADNIEEKLIVNGIDNPAYVFNELISTNVEEHSNDKISNNPENILNLISIDADVRHRQTGEMSNYKKRTVRKSLVSDSSSTNFESNIDEKPYSKRDDQSSMIKIPLDSSDSISENEELKIACNELKTITFDDMIDKIGQFGPYQFLILFTFTIAVLLEAMLTMIFVYTAAIPDYWCATPELDRLNLTTENKTQLAIPLDPDTGAPSMCMMYNIDYTNWTTNTALYWLQNKLYSNASEIACRNGYTYDQSTFENTLVTEWNLVCGNQMLPSLAYSMIGIGQLMGALIWGTVIDVWGRRWPYVLATGLMIVLALAGSFVPWFALYLVIQFIFGITTVATYSVGVTVAVEITGVRVRGHLSTAVNYFWTLGYMILPGVAYEIRSWRRLQMTLSLFALSFSLLLVFIKESPRWLYTHNRSKEADNILRLIAKSNKKQFPEGYTIIVPKEEEREGSLRDLFGTANMTIVSIILFIIWFASSIVYFGVSLFLPTLSGSPYLNFFLSGMIECPGYLIAQLSIAYLGRRRPLCIVMICSGLSLLGALTVKKLSLDDPEMELNWLILVLTMVGKMCITASWSIAICFTSELYPTVIRGRGMLTCTLCGNMGNVLAPLVSLLGVYSQLYPLGVFGFITITAGLLSLILPETRDKPLTDSVHQSAKENRLACLCCADSHDS